MTRSAELSATPEYCGLSSSATLVVIAPSNWYLYSLFDSNALVFALVLQRAIRLSATIAPSRLGLARPKMDLNHKYPLVSVINVS